MQEINFQKICSTIKHSCYGSNLYTLRRGFCRTYDRAKPDTKIAYIETAEEASQYGMKELPLCINVRFLFVTLCAYQFSKTEQKQSTKFKDVLEKLFNGKNSSESLKKRIEKLLSIERTDDSRFFKTLSYIIGIAHSEGLIVDERDLLETLCDWDNAPERIAKYIMSQQER